MGSANAKSSLDIWGWRYVTKKSQEGNLYGDVEYYGRDGSTLYKRMSVRKKESRYYIVLWITNAIQSLPASTQKDIELREWQQWRRDISRDRLLDFVAVFVRLSPPPTKIIYTYDFNEAQGYNMIKVIKVTHFWA